MRKALYGAVGAVVVLTGVGCDNGNDVLQSQSPYLEQRVSALEEAQTENVENWRVQSKHNKQELVRIRREIEETLKSPRESPKSLPTATLGPEMVTSSSKPLRTSTEVRAEASGSGTKAAAASGTPAGSSDTTASCGCGSTTACSRQRRELPRRVKEFLEEELGPLKKRVNDHEVSLTDHEMRLQELEKERVGREEEKVAEEKEKKASTSMSRPPHKLYEASQRRLPTGGWVYKAAYWEK